MRLGDAQLAVPYTDYRNTKAIIEAMPSPVGGMTAHATDTGENSYYDEVALAWVG
jgi:hypothetical protein